MPLPSLDRRSTAVLLEEQKRLTELREKMADVARALQAEPHFAEPIERIDEAYEEIEREIANRSTHHPKNGDTE